MKTDSSSYSYLLDKHFFTLVEGEDVKGGEIEAEIEIQQARDVFEFTFSLNGMVEIICDRCLDNMVYPISVEETVLVEMGEFYNDEDDRRIIISEHEGTINVAWLMYEFIALAIPIHHVHEEGECNQDMLQKLDGLLTVEADDDDDDEIENNEKDEIGEVDPRWNELKKILDNN